MKDLGGKRLADVMAGVKEADAERQDHRPTIRQRLTSAAGCDRSRMKVIEHTEQEQGHPPRRLRCA